MVDFKYHVVSIVAVFLALAIGIVLGTNVLSGDVLKNLKTQTNQLRHDAQGLRGQIQQEQAQLATDSAFAQAVEPLAVNGRLTGARVLVVALPGAPKPNRDSTVKTLTEAGAVITGEVDVAPAFADAAQATALDALVSSLPLPVSGLDAAGGDIHQRAAAMLATALVSGPAFSPAAVPVSPPASASPGDVSSATPGATATARANAHIKVTPSPTSSSSGDPSDRAITAVDERGTEVFAAMEKSGFVKSDSDPVQLADLVVAVAPAAPSKAATDPAISGSLLDLIAAFDRAGAPTVLAGPVGSASSGGLVAQLRGNATLSKAVSSVDDVDGAPGRMAVVFALLQQAAGVVAHYGTGQGAVGPLPPLPPLPS